MKTKTLNPFEQWMVQSNLKAIQAGAESAAARVARLHANGYPQIAKAVHQLTSLPDFLSSK